MVSVVHHVVHESIEHMAKSITQRIFHSAYIKPMELAALKRSSRIVAVSRSTERAIRDVFGEWNVDVVLNGVDTEFFTPGSDSDCSTAPENRPLELLFVGKRSRRKGFDLIANLVDELGPLARFTCIGGQAKARLKLPPGQYPGRVSLAELRNAYRRSDALLMLSRLEGFGYAAAEAMACGTPVVCLEGTAVHEIAGPTAITAEFDAAGKPTAETIAQLRDLAKLRGLRSLAREKARTELSEVRWLDQMEDVIQSAISHTGSLLAP